MYSFGTNRPIVEEAKTLWEYIIENFEDEMLRVLCLAAAVALIVGIINEGWKEVHGIKHFRVGSMVLPFSLP
jgi:hypothetical protein